MDVVCVYHLFALTPVRHTPFASTPLQVYSAHDQLLEHIFH